MSLSTDPTSRTTDAGAVPAQRASPEVDKGGLFAAWEVPELFATEIRAAFRPLG